MQILYVRLCVAIVTSLYEFHDLLLSMMGKLCMEIINNNNTFV